MLNNKCDFAMAESISFSGNTIVQKFNDESQWLLCISRKLRPILLSRVNFRHHCAKVQRGHQGIILYFPFF